MCNIGLNISSNFTSHHPGTCPEPFTLHLAWNSASTWWGCPCCPCGPILLPWEKAHASLWLHWSAFRLLEQGRELPYQSTRGILQARNKLRDGFQGYLRLKYQEKPWHQWPKTEEGAWLSLDLGYKRASVFVNCGLKLCCPKGSKSDMWLLNTWNVADTN